MTTFEVDKTAYVAEGAVIGEGSSVRRHAIIDTNAYVGKNCIVADFAKVEENARIGDGTKIWDMASIRSDARIGANCIIGRGVQVDIGVRIGDKCKIQNGVSVYHGVTLEDEVFVGPAVVFTNDHNPRATGEWKITETIVRKGASLGANCTIICGNEIGSYALVAAGAVVTKPVDPYQVVAGVPARPIGWADAKGSIVSRDTNPPKELHTLIEEAKALAISTEA